MGILPWPCGAVRDGMRAGVCPQAGTAQLQLQHGRAQLCATCSSVCPVTEDCSLPCQAAGEGGHGCPCHSLTGDGCCCCCPSPMTLTEAVSAKDTPPAFSLLPPWAADLQQLGLQQCLQRPGACGPAGSSCAQGSA